MAGSDQNSESFIIQIEADATKASRAFDQIHKQISEVTAAGNQSFARLTAAFGQAQGSAVALAASFTPVGRSAMALLGTLESVITVGRDLAKAFGAETQFTQFETAINALGTSILSTAGYLLNQGTGSVRTFGQTMSSVAVGDVGMLERALANLGSTAAGISRHLQGMVESLKPADQRSSEALEAQINALHARIEAARRSLVGRVNELLPEMVPDRFRRWVDDMQTEMLRLGDLLSSRIELADPTIPPFLHFSRTLEEAIEALRRQNRELEISVATFGMAAGAAARYRAELEMLRHFSDEDGPRGPLFEQRGPVVRQEIDALAANRQAMEDRERGVRVDRMFEGAEGQTRLLQAQARALGMTAGETARLTFEERLLTHLRQQRVPIDDAMLERVREMGTRNGEAAEQLKNLQRELQHVQEIGRTMSTSMERVFGDWITGAETNWNRFFNTLARDMAVLALRHNILQPLFGGGGVQGAGLFGQLFGFGGGKAEGGPVAPGMGYLVGERGPELFLPDTSGTIVPNGAGGGATTINMRVDLAGANGDETIARISAQAARAGAAAAVAESNAAVPARQRRLHTLGT